MEKLTIKSLTEKEITTKYGESIKYTLTFEEKPGVYVDCWRGKWNAHFEVGTVIEPTAEQWQSREYKGKTYFTLKAPPEARGFGNIDELTKRVEVLERDFETMKDFFINKDGTNKPDPKKWEGAGTTGGVEKSPSVNPESPRI